MSRHLLITGGSGQVGRAMTRLPWPGDIVLHAPTRQEMDLADPNSIAAVFAARQYDAVVSAGAYTSVDRAEGDSVVAFQANAIGPAALSRESAMLGIPIVHVSTDYVFDGSADGFYSEDAPVAPLGVYGASKLAGELAVACSNPRHAIVRTAWVVSSHGSNFVKTMLRIGRANAVVRVVDDQVGCPTSAGDLASALRTIVLGMIGDGNAPTGTYHFVNAGEATWCGLAREIFARAALNGGPTPHVQGITTADYPTPARRPANSRLGTARIERIWQIAPRPWQEAIAGIVDELSLDAEVI